MSLMIRRKYTNIAEWLMKSIGLLETDRETCSVSGSLSQRSDKDRFSQELLTIILTAQDPLHIGCMRPGDMSGMLEGASPNKHEA